MKNPKIHKMKRHTMSKTFPLFDSIEDGQYVGLNNIVMFHWTEGKSNLSIESRLVAKRKSVCVSTTLRGVLP